MLTSVAPISVNPEIKTVPEKIKKNGNYFLPVQRCAPDDALSQQDDRRHRRLLDGGDGGPVEKNPDIQPYMEEAKADPQGNHPRPIRSPQPRMAAVERKMEKEKN